MEDIVINNSLTRKEKIKAWFKDPYNLTFLGILVAAFIIRLYYFIITQNQPLWWDESSYMAAAKNYAGIGSYQLESIRLPGFSLLMSLFFSLGFANEPFMRFIALFIPSIILIFLTYICIKEMYPDKRIALISTAIMAVLWENLFYSNRFMTENFALIFQFLAFYIIYKSYIKKQDVLFIRPKYSLLFAAILSAISLLFRPGNVAFVPAAILFLIFINKSSILTKKKIPLIIISIILLTVLSFLLYPYFKSYISFYYNPSSPLAWNSLSVFSGFYGSTVSWIPSLLYYAFIFGIIILVVDFIINFEKIKNITNNSENLDIKSDMFNLILIICVLAMFIFIIKPQTIEYRWFFPLLTGMFAFTSKGIIIFSEYVGRLIAGKKLIVFLIMLILLPSLYTQFVHGDSIIKDKLSSYQQVKDAGLWIKENSEKQDIVVSQSYPQTAYYSERKVYPWSLFKNETDFDNFLKNTSVKYVLLSVFEQHPDWAYNWPMTHNQTIIPVQGYYLDKEQKNIALVIYLVKNPIH